MPLARIHGLNSCGHIGCPGPSGRASGGWMNATLPLKLPARVPRRSMGFDAASASARPFATEARPRLDVPWSQASRASRDTSGEGWAGRVICVRVRRPLEPMFGAQAPDSCPSSTLLPCPSSPLLPFQQWRRSRRRRRETKRRPQMLRPRRTQIGCRPSYPGPASSSRRGRPSLPCYVLRSYCL